MPIDFPSNPQLDELYSAEDRTWRWTGVYWRAVSTTIGYTGSQGEQGEGFRVLGSFPTVADLPNDSSGQPGDAYVITETGDLWSWDGFNWNNIGRFVGYTGSQGFAGSQGPAGNFGGVTLDYTFSSNTDSSQDPGTGKIKFNDVSIPSSTLMYIGDTDDLAVNLDNYLATIDASTSGIRGHFRITRKLYPEQFVIFAITEASVNQGSYFIVNCAYVSGNLSDSSTAFDDGDDILITFARTGDKGDIGYTGSAGFTGSQGATGTSIRIVGALATSSLLPFPHTGDIGDGYLIEDTGNLWLWDGNQWNDIGKLTGEVGPTGYTGSEGDIGYTGSEGESTFTWGPNPPPNPAVGDRWFDTIVGAVAVYVDDGDTLAWLEVAGSGFMGQTGYTGSGGGGGPRVTSIDYPGDATAADPAGGETVGIVGSGFQSGAHILLDNTAVGQVSFVNENRLEIVTPAKTAGTYNYLYIINPDGAAAIYVPGLQYSGLPTWGSPGAGSLGSVYETQSISQSFSASSDSSVTYSLLSGTLPAGSTLDPATGTLTGTASNVENATTYTFTIRATDAESQTSDRQFSLTVDPDAITWNFPINGAVVEFSQDQFSSASLSATALTGATLSYSVTNLPDGLTLSGDTVSGTATTLGDTQGSATAFAATSEATAVISVTWRVILGGDQFFNQTTLLLNGDDNTFITDASDNAFTITPNGDTRPSAFSPYNGGWSNYFDGSGDWLTAPNNTAFDFGSSDWTVEAWLYLSTSSGEQLFWGKRASTNVFAAVLLGVNASGTGTNRAFIIGSTSVGSWNVTATTGSIDIPLNTWVHLAYVRNDTNIRVYVNGVLDFTLSNISGALISNSDAQVIGASSTLGQTGIINGYISNLRCVKGTAVYTSNFTPPTEPLTSVSGTSLLTCQSNRLIDNSTNAFTITKSGDVRVTGFAPFTDTDTSTGSGYFDGSGDFITAADNDSLDLGNTDFTIDLWIYPTSVSNDAIVAGKHSSSNGSWLIFRNGSVMKFYSSTDGTNWNITNGVTIGSIAIGQWYHIAVTREGSSFRCFLNGVIGSTTTSSSTIYNGTQVVVVGSNTNGTAGYAGYVSNFRIIKGTALYTEDFDDNLPTAPLTAVSGTELLTLQNRTGYNNSQPIDESGIKNVITRNGNASVGSYSPHVPSGWSGYFDGTGDYLTVPSGASVSGSGAFTVEFWCYMNGPQTDSRILSGGANQITTAYSSDGGFSYGKAGVVNVFGGNIGSALGQWRHIVIGKSSGGTYRVWSNGQSVGTGTDSQTYNSGTVYIGSTSVPSAYFNGYIADLRISNADVYGTGNTTISVPTAPLEPIAGTSLLTLRGPSFTDDGPNRFAITRNGDTRITPFSPFAPHTVTPDSYSVYFDGTTSALNPPDGEAVLTPGDVDYTVEGWYMLTGNYKNYNNLWDWRTTGFGGGYQIRLTTNGYLQVTTSSSLWTDTENQLLSGVWYHVAFVKDAASDEYHVYLNGTLIKTGSSGASATSGRLTIGANTDRTTHEWGGYISNFRITMSKVYTGNFTVPLSSLSKTQNSSTNISAISDSSTVTILTCQSPTFIDNSDNNFAITVAGNSQPTKFNPFGETATTGVEYSPASHGGSINFDGSGDYLPLGDRNEFSLVGDFSMEAWMYLRSFGNEEKIINKWSGGGQEYLFDMVTGNLWRFYWAPHSTSSALITSNTAFNLNEWHHVAVARRGSTITMYLNGKPVGTGTNSGNPTNTSIPLYICAYDTTSGYIDGYVTGVRIMNGATAYTGPFVPSTAPLEALPGTVVLINGTNAAIQDKTGRNVLETVGNARVVNGVKKYGSGAMYFDGTGDYLNIYDPTFQNSVGSGDWTFECWVYFNSLPTGSAPSVVTALYHLKNDAALATTVFILEVTSGGAVSLSTGTALIASGTAGKITTGSWIHFACVRNSGTIKTYFNGVQDISVANTTTYNGSYVQLGAWRYNTFDSSMNGFIDDLRITKGVARHREDFPPPSSGYLTK